LFEDLLLLVIHVGLLRIFKKLIYLILEERVLIMTDVFKSIKEQFIRQDIASIQLDPSVNVSRDDVSQFLELKKKYPDKRIALCYHHLDQIDRLIPINKFFLFSKYDFRKKIDHNVEYEELIPEDISLIRLLSHLYPEFEFFGADFQSLLIYGRPGTFKSTIARTIATFLCAEDIVEVTCEQTVEGEFKNLLFGSSKGQYTDALEKKGIIQELWEKHRRGDVQTPVLIINEIQNLKPTDMLSLYSLMNKTENEQCFIDYTTHKKRKFKELKLIYVSTDSVTELKEKFGKPFVDRLSYPVLKPSHYNQLTENKKRNVIHFFLNQSIRNQNRKSIQCERGVMDLLLDIGSKINDFRILEKLCSQLMTADVINKSYFMYLISQLNINNSFQTYKKPLLNKDFQTCIDKLRCYESLISKNYSKKKELLWLYRVKQFIDISQQTISSEEKARLFFGINNISLVSSVSLQVMKKAYRDFKRHFSKRYGAVEDFYNFNSHSAQILLEDNGLILDSDVLDNFKTYQEFEDMIVFIQKRLIQKLSRQGLTETGISKELQVNTKTIKRLMT
jgi:SpoVK/Ycf46/Vps4 family AAA+-type ATPase